MTCQRAYMSKCLHVHRNTRMIVDPPARARPQGYGLIKYYITPISIQYHLANWWLLYSGTHSAITLL